MDKTQFILAIVANIATLIIMWLVRRVTRRAKTLLTSGTITTKVRQMFTTRMITILGTLLITLLNLWILIEVIRRNNSFDRLALLSAIVLSLVSAYWVTRLVNALGFGMAGRLRQIENNQALLEAATRERFKPRWMENEQAMAFQDCLRDNAVGRFDILYLANDVNRDEESAFANQLHMYSLHLSTTPQGASGRHFPINGVSVMANNTDSHSPAFALTKALECAAIPCKAVSSEHVAKNAVILLVGRQPFLEPQ